MVLKSGLTHVQFSDVIMTMQDRLMNGSIEDLDRRMRCVKPI